MDLLQLLLTVPRANLPIGQLVHFLPLISCHLECPPTIRTHFAWTPSSPNLCHLDRPRLWFKLCLTVLRVTNLHVYICSVYIYVGLLLFIDKNVNMRLVGEATEYDETIWVGLEPCGRYRQEKWDSKQPSRPGVAQPARQRPGRTRSSCSLSFT